MENRFAVLDGIRGIAAIFIVTIHTRAFWDIPPSRAYLAVDIFFILSGFVIAHAYETKLQDAKISLREFVLIRLIRLYPLFLLSVAFSAVVHAYPLLTGRPSEFEDIWQLAAAVIKTALFIPNHATGPNDNALFHLNVPYWSLAAELLVNFGYGVLRPRLSNRVLGAIVILSALALARCALYFGHLNEGSDWGALRKH